MDVASQRVRPRARTGGKREARAEGAHQLSEEPLGPGVVQALHHRGIERLLGMRREPERLAAVVRAIEMLIPQFDKIQRARAKAGGNGHARG